MTPIAHFSLAKVGFLGCFIFFVGVEIAMNASHNLITPLQQSVSISRLSTTAAAIAIFILFCFYILIATRVLFYGNIAVYADRNLIIIMFPFLGKIEMGEICRIESSRGKFGLSIGGDLVIIKNSGLRRIVQCGLFFETPDIVQRRIESLLASNIPLG